MRRGILLLTFLASINLISAAGIGELLDRIGGENIVLIGTFLISFALINVIIGRMSLFQHELGRTKSSANVIAAVLGLLITYGIYKSGMDLEGIFFSLGISGGLFSQIINIGILVGIVYLFIKFGKKLFLSRMNSFQVYQACLRRFLLSASILQL